MNKRFVIWLVAGVTGLALGTGAWAQDMSSDVMQQISTISSIKANFSPAQKKMDSALAYGILTATNDASVASVTNAIAPLTANDVSATESSGTTAATASSLVNIEFTGEVNAIASAVNAAGGTVIYSASNFGALTAAIPVSAITSLVASDAVTSAKVSLGFTTHVGSITSQGYVSHEANKTVNTLGINGAGIKIGVLSDSASAARVAALIASGDLGPNTTVLPGLASTGTDEGAAMMEIVQDLAPGAQIYFATANGGQAAFANNILALAAAGCKVIVDDVAYFAEPAFQDGVISQAINTVTANGVIYFSSAGNSGSLTKNTSGTWEGDFVSGGPVAGIVATSGESGLVHNFGSASSPVLFDVLTAATTSPIALKWSDRNGASSNDYDLFLTNSTGTVLKKFSNASQDGTQDPLEIFGCTNSAPAGQPSNACAGGDRLVVVLFAGAPRALHLDTNRARLQIATTGATTGHNAAANTVSMAATFWNSAKTGTKAFTGVANTNETFSSDGPRRIFYTPNGTAITPGNFLFGTNGGTLLQKPDFAAADGVSTRTPGFLPFYGTSAASPHAAAIAALILQARPTYTPAQIRTALQMTALDSMAAGADRDSGYGIAMAYAAVMYAMSH